MAEMYLHQPLFIAFNTDGEQLLSIADSIYNIIYKYSNWKSFKR